MWFFEKKCRFLPQCDYFFILINFLKVLLTSRKMQLLASNPQISEVSSLLGGYPVVSLLSYLSLLTQMLLECICTHNKQTFSTLYTQWRRRLHYSFSGSHSFKETSIMTPIFWQPWLERKGSFLVRKKSESLTFFFQYDGYTIAVSLAKQQKAPSAVRYYDYGTFLCKW